MTSYVQVRACPSPNNFFDEIIPDDGIKIGEWRFTIRRISMLADNLPEGKDFVDIAWLYAESDYDEAQLAGFRQDKLPSFMQIVQALAGLRRVHISGEIKFSMFFEEFVKDGVVRNVEPYRLEIGVDIRLIRVTDGAGSVVFDAEAHAAERAQRARQDAKNELRVTAEAVARHLGDDFFRRSWESFNLAFGKDEHAINHLFDVRDAVLGKFEKEEVARKALGIPKRSGTTSGKSSIAVR